jgi:hypothetical protein
MGRSLVNMGILAPRMEGGAFTWVSKNKWRFLQENYDDFDLILIIFGGHVPQ